MWAITNQTRYKADRTFTRAVEGAELGVVAVRASFLLKPDGQLEPESEQQDVCLTPVYTGEPGHSSLDYDIDLVRRKTGTDVMISR